MSTKMLRVLSVVVVIAMLAVSQPLSASVLKVWHFESDNAMADSWEFAMREFEAMYPDVKIEFEQQTLEGMQKIAVMVLSSPELPDVMQSNTGTATAGLYASGGLLTDLTEVAKERGWDKVMCPSIQFSCRYDENGIMGVGNLYGVSNFGEYVMVYYHKGMFEEYGVEVPTSLEEFEAIADKFLAAGIQPLTVGALDIWPQLHNWWELVLYRADRELITNYLLLQGDVDFRGEAFTFGAEKFIEHMQRGYYGPNPNAISYDDSNAAFTRGRHPMYLTGTWMFSSFLDQITDFDWSTFLMPGEKLVTGSSGGIWVVPQNAKNKEMAYNFIDITVRKEAQTVMANKGGIPLNPDLSQVQSEKIREMLEGFTTLIENDALGFYPDWPVPGYFDILGSSSQEMIAGTMSAAEFNDYIGAVYNEYKKSLME